MTYNNMTYNIKHSGYALKPAIASAWVDEDYQRHGFEKSGWFWVMKLDTKLVEGAKDNIYFYLAITPQHDVIFWLSNDNVAFTTNEDGFVDVDVAYSDCAVDNVYDIPREFINFIAGGYIYEKQP
jgi:hypothetical protein